MRKALLFFTLGLIFLVFFFIGKAKFGCAGIAEVSESYNVDSLKIQYAQNLEKLVGLLKQKLEALNYQAKNGLSIASSTVSSTVQSVSAAYSSESLISHHPMSSEVLPYYFPSWHLIPGQCVPKYY